MDQFIKSIRKSVEDKNWFSALFMAISIPDICGGLTKNPKKGHKKRFFDWFDNYLAPEYTYISGEAFWQLRCSIFHSGTHIDKKLKKALSGAELLIVTYEESPFHDSFVRWDKNRSFVFLRIDVFCEDVCNAIKQWEKDMANESKVQERINDLFYIEKGVKASEMIMGKVNLEWHKFSIKRLYTDIPARKGLQPFWDIKPEI